MLDPRTPADQLKQYKGIILSGGPASVNDPNSPKIDPALYDLGNLGGDLGIPILGVCYGHQLTMHTLGGRVQKGTVGEYGLTSFTVTKPVGIFAKLEPKTYRVYASHFDTVAELPPGFESIGSTPDDPLSAAQNPARKIYTVQFHPEVTHTECGLQILDAFLDITGVARDWSIDKFIESELASIVQKVGDKKVFMLISGGVDSTVAYALLARAKSRIYAMLVDTGFMRLHEVDQIKESLGKIGIKNLHVEDASAEYFEALKGVTDPEQKRKIIGDKFLEIQRRVAKNLNLNPDEWLLGQGTIYPDTIESGGTKNADKIKTHHNRVPEIEEMIKAGRVIEPLKELYKDEVRKVGKKLGLPEEMVNRHPFPGPGLAVRCLCLDEPSPEPAAAEIEAKIQADYASLIPGLTAHVLPIKSVGVQGDERTYRHPVALELPAFGPSPSQSNFDWSILRSLAPRLTNQFRAINRVLLLVACKNPPPVPLPPLQTTDYQLQTSPSTLTPERIALLQKADELVNAALPALDPEHKVWQFPVVLVPLSINSSPLESIVLRPVSSQEAMTANFTELPWDGPNGILELAKKILALTDNQGNAQISAVFYDLTNKPPGTIEWE